MTFEYKNNCERCGELNPTNKKLMYCVYCKRLICSKCVESNLCHDCIQLLSPDIQIQFKKEVEKLQSKRTLWTIMTPILMILGIGLIPWLIYFMPLLAIAIWSIGMIGLGPTQLTKINRQLLNVGDKYVYEYLAPSGKTIDNNTIKICGNCHQKVMNQSQFCPQCGKELVYSPSPGGVMNNNVDPELPKKYFDISKLYGSTSSKNPEN